jgi:hypothetical protein
MEGDRGNFNLRSLMNEEFKKDYCNLCKIAPRT